jgi:integral membrane protein
MIDPADRLPVHFGSLQSLHRTPELHVLTLFRAVSLAEGLSLLVILSVTAGFISRDYVFVLGMTHGVIFIAYVLLSLLISHRRGWSVLIWLAIVAAGLVPFAFLLVERLVKWEPDESKPRS